MEFAGPVECRREVLFVRVFAGLKKESKREKKERMRSYDVGREDVGTLLFAVMYLDLLMFQTQLYRSMSTLEPLHRLQYLAQPLHLQTACPCRLSAPRRRG